jgi:hypothetical protein
MCLVVDGIKDKALPESERRRTDMMSKVQNFILDFFSNACI